MRGSCMTLVLLVVWISDARAAILGPGDIAFIGYGSSTNGIAQVDSIRFVALAELSPGESIFLTDEEFPLGTLEGRLRYVTNQVVALGSVISIVFDSGVNTGTASFGTLTEMDAGFALSSSGDGLIAYTGTFGVPSDFLTGLNYSTTAPLGDLTGTGLALGVNTVDVSALPLRRKAEYRGALHFSDVASARTAINDPANWVGGDDSLQFKVPSGAGVVTFGPAPMIPVPEPATFVVWMTLGIVGSGAAIHRHRPYQRVVKSLEQAVDCRK